MICAYCETPFTSKRSDARFCSPACRNKAHRATDNDATANPATDTPEALYAEAQRLYEVQVAERGTALNRDNKTIRGPYVATPEREARARKIGYLRRRAARLEKEAA